MKWKQRIGWLGVTVAIVLPHTWIKREAHEVKAAKTWIFGQREHIQERSRRLCSKELYEQRPDIRLKNEVTRAVRRANKAGYICPSTIRIGACHTSETLSFLCKLCNRYHLIAERTLEANDPSHHQNRRKKKIKLNLLPPRAKSVPIYLLLTQTSDFACPIHEQACYQ